MIHVTGVCDLLKKKGGVISFMKLWALLLGIFFEIIFLYLEYLYLTSFHLGGSLFSKPELCDMAAAIFFFFGFGFIVIGLRED
jgi:hypothetical protein